MPRAAREARRTTGLRGSGRRATPPCTRGKARSSGHAFDRLGRVKIARGCPQSETAIGEVAPPRAIDQRSRKLNVRRNSTDAARRCRTPMDFGCRAAAARRHPQAARYWPSSTRHGRARRSQVAVVVGRLRRPMLVGDRRLRSGWRMRRERCGECWPSISGDQRLLQLERATEPCVK